MRTEIYRSPWFDCHGYLACKVKYDDGSRQTVLQHREMMEVHLGRKLNSDEIVHHKDGEIQNNVIENLEVMLRADHTRMHNAEPEFLVFNCPICGCEFNCLARRYRANQLKKGGAGPFCGRSCAGRFNQKRK